MPKKGRHRTGASVFLDLDDELRDFGSEIAYTKAAGPYIGREGERETSASTTLRTKPSLARLIELFRNKRCVLF